MRIPYKEALNQAQYEAVTCMEGPVLVIAGAGSGKTRTLTYRVARIVEEGVDPRSVLLLTFTRKAAQEMLSRAAQILDHRVQEVSGGTFHSFAHLILRRHATALGFSSRFVVMDRPDSEDLIDELCKDLLPDFKGRGVPRKHTIADIFSKSANKSMSVEAVLLDDYAHFAGHAEALARLFEAYTQEKTRRDLMDFDDLLLHARVLLSTEPGVREAVSGAYRHIMVDEYQDTNLVQADILRLIAARHANVMAVGDDCQSIYGFRGANFENIMRFPEIFPGTRLIRLEENYRSLAPVLRVTNAIISQARRKYDKTLFTTRKGGAVPELVATADEKAQADFVVAGVQKLLDQGVPPQEIAVLFRAGYHAFVLEVELTRAGIPFVKYGGFRFTEAAHVKDLLAHLRVLAFPGDRLAWSRALLLLDHVGPRTARTIADTVCAGGAKAVKPKPAWKEGWDRLAGFVLGRDPAKASVAEMGEAALEYYAPILKDRYDNWPKRIKDLEQLLQMMGRYQSLDWFLSDMALEPPTTSVDNALSPEASGRDRLVLSTVHSAKGLEWHTVFVIWVLDGRFPSIQSVMGQSQEMEEELRLTYVAATRAKQGLYFVYPTDVFDHKAQTYLYRPSRFLANIPESILKRGRF